MKKESGRKSVGASVDEKLWQRLRAQAIMEDRKSGEVLDDAIRLYLKTKEQQVK